MEPRGIVQMLSSKLLSQILSAGDLFNSGQVDPSLIPIRKMYESILQKRIFLADRLEKLEKALQRSGLIPGEPSSEEDKQDTNDGEEFIVEEVDIVALEQKLSEESVAAELAKHLNDVMEDTTWTQLFDTVSQRKETEEMERVAEEQKKIEIAQRVKEREQLLLMK